MAFSGKMGARCKLLAGRQFDDFFCNGASVIDAPVSGLSLQCQYRQ
jgi:hypothetical protein